MATGVRGEPRNIEVQSNYEKIKDASKIELEEYNLAHPELGQLMKDFVTNLLAFKPDNVEKFTSQYFARFIPEEVLGPHPTQATEDSEEEEEAEKEQVKEEVKEEEEEAAEPAAEDKEDKEELAETLVDKTVDEVISEGKADAEAKAEAKDETETVANETPAEEAKAEAKDEAEVVANETPDEGKTEVVSNEAPAAAEPAAEAAEPAAAAEAEPASEPVLDQEALGNLFDKLDKIADGKLNYLEIKKGLKTSPEFKDLLDGSSFKKFWKQADDDGDKVVTKEEFISFFTPEEPASEPVLDQEALGNLFDKLDKIADGKLNYLEIKKGLKTFPEFKGLLDGSSFKKFWKQADDDGDKVVTKEEFISFFTPEEPVAAEPAAEPAAEAVAEEPASEPAAEPAAEAATEEPAAEPAAEAKTE